MKNVFSTLLAFCLGLFISVAIIACANDTDDYSDNTIEVLSRQVSELTERMEALEAEIQKSALPRVLKGEWSCARSYSEGHCVYDYVYDEQGRLIKINETYAGIKGPSTGVISVTYGENQCTITNPDGEEQHVLIFETGGFSNVQAVNNLIVSNFAETVDY